jgi:hypothetical protein
MRKESDIYEYVPSIVHNIPGKSIALSVILVIVIVIVVVVVY